MPKSTDKLTKKQVMAIPIFLNQGYRGRIWTIGMIAKRYGVSWQAIFYWVKKLREKGIEVKTRKRGQVGLLD
jgi:transposase